MPEFIWELPAVSPAADESSSVSGGAIDHTAAALRRLVTQFQKPNMKAMVRAFVAPLQDLEQAIVDCLTNRTIDDAIGEQLNVLGRIVGQEQVDVTDTTYRSLVRARIPANKSEGLGKDVLLVVRLVLTDYSGQEEVVAAGVMSLQIVDRLRAEFALIVNAIDLPQDLAALVVEQFLREITGTGIRGVLEYTVQEDDSLEHHDDDFALDDLVSAFATATFAGGFSVRAKTAGTAGNGILVEIVDAGAGTAGALVTDDPDHVVVRFNTTPMDFTTDTTWAALYALINTSAYVETFDEVASGAMVSGDAESQTTAGAIDGGGTGFGDVNRYPTTSAQATAFALLGDWQHIHLCDNGAAIEGVTQDALALAQCPATVEEFETLLADEPDLTAPNWALYNFSELAGNVIDATGNGHDLAPSGAITYGYGPPSWTRPFVAINDNVASKLTTAIADANTESFLIIMLVSLQGTPAALRTLFEHPNAWIEVSTTPRYQINAGSLTVGSLDPVPTGDPGPVYLVALQHDVTNTADKMHLNGGEVDAATFFNANAAGVISFGKHSAGASASCFAAFGWAAIWRGARAELTEAQVARLMRKLKGRGDISTIGGIDFDEADGTTPQYGLDGILPDGDHAFGVGTAVVGGFQAPSPTLQPNATDDFAFACAIPELGTGEVQGIFPLFATEILGTKINAVKILGGQLTYQVSDGVITVTTAPIAVPDRPFTLMVVLERGAVNELRTAVCEVGGTPVVSAAADISGLGGLTHSQDTYIGIGDAETPTRLAFWMASKDTASCAGLSAGISASIQSFTDYLVSTGGLRAAME